MRKSSFDLRQQILLLYRVSALVISGLMLVALFFNLKFGSAGVSELGSMSEMKMNLLQQIQWAMTLNRPDYIFGACALVLMVLTPVLRNFLCLLHYGKQKQYTLVFLTLVAVFLVNVGVFYSITD